jgi:hypothetical protein
MLSGTLRWAVSSVGALALMTALLGACVGSGATSGSPLPAAKMSLGVWNGSTLTVTLVVNGVTIESLAAGQADYAIPASRLPPLPWQAEVRSPSGRVLVSLPVQEGDVWETVDSSGGGASKGDANRIDLSCGRIDIWSGPPLGGPAPPPSAGSPGDCAP